VNRAHNECHTTNIWSLFIQYLLLNSSIIASNNAKSLSWSDGSPPLLRLRGEEFSGKPLGYIMIALPLEASSIL